MGWPDDFAGVLKDPEDFFGRKKSEESLFPAWSYYMILFAVSLAAVFVLGIPFRFILEPSGLIFSPAVSIAFDLFGMVLLLCFAAGLVFVTIAFMHLFLLLVGAKKGYRETFKAFCYGSTPYVFIALCSVLLNFAVLFNFSIVWLIVYGLALLGITIWMYTIQVIGVSTLHQISTARAVVGVVVLPILSALLIFLVLGLIFLASLSVLGIPITGNVVGQLL